MSGKQATTVKDVAAWALRELNVSMPYVLDFEANDSVYLFDQGNVRRISPSSELMEKIREIEKERKVKIYAVTHDYLFAVGEMYSFLCISLYEEDWDGMVYSIRNHAGLVRVYAYVYNVAIPEYSESGYVLLRSEHGKLVRVG